VCFGMSRGFRKSHALGPSATFAGRRGGIRKGRECRGTVKRCMALRSSRCPKDASTSRRYFPSLKDVKRELMTPADWQRIFGEQSNKISDRRRAPSDLGRGKGGARR